MTKTRINSDSANVNSISGSRLEDGAVIADKIADDVEVGKFQFLQGGDEAESRNAQLKLREVVSVKDFGAKGDDSNDDTQAIQNALLYCRETLKVCYVPAGIYRVSSTITVPWFSTIIGDGCNSTVFKGVGTFTTPGPILYLQPRQGSVTEDVGNYPPSAGGPVVNNYYAYFSVIGTNTSQRGGIHCRQNQTVFDRVNCGFFSSGPQFSVGDPATDTRYGFHSDYTVSVEFRSCSASLCDIGFLSTNDSSSVLSSPVTTVHYLNCSVRICRVHAIKWVNFMSHCWKGGLIESNWGDVTVSLSANSIYAIGSFIGDIHFEGNHGLSPVRAPGTKLIHIDVDPAVTTQGSICLQESFVNDGRAQYTLDADGLVLCVICNSRVNGPVIIRDQTKEFSCSNTEFLSGLTNNAQSGVVNTGQLSITKKSRATLTTSTPQVGFTRYATLPAVTVTELKFGHSDQELTLEAQAGSVLSGSEFRFINGSTTFVPSPGCLIDLKRNEDNTLWIYQGHVTVSEFEALSNASTVSIDERDVWYVNDSNTLGISTLTGYGEGRTITIYSKHTGMNTTSILTTGNIRLSGGGSFIMGSGDVLRLQLLNGSWVEIGRLT